MYGLGKTGLREERTKTQAPVRVWKGPQQGQPTSFELHGLTLVQNGADHEGEPGLNPRLPEGSMAATCQCVLSGLHVTSVISCPAPLSSGADKQRSSSPLTRA